MRYTTIEKLIFISYKIIYNEILLSINKNIYVCSHFYNNKK